MPGGVGGIAYISDADENVSRVSQAGRIFVSESYTRVKNHSPINVSAASGGSVFETANVGKVILYSESGNNVMWWGGSGDDSPYSGHGMPIYGGEKTPLIPVTNFNAVRVCAHTSGQIVYAIGFLNGGETQLGNIVPEAPPAEVDSTLPFVVSHSPVSGFSGVALNQEISVTFSEEIAEASIVSGVFHLSPAHNVTTFRDVSVPEKITMTPNVNLSGVTVYYVGVTDDVTDLAGNHLSGRLIFPFTTISGAPPPDVTAPVVSGTTPVSGATNVSAAGNVIVLFSEAMLSGSINQGTMYLSYLSGVVRTSGISGTVSLAVDAKTVTLDPTNNLSGSANVHINVLSGVQDLAGNNLAAHDRSRRFTIATPVTPVVSGTSPASGAQTVSISNDVTITFNTTMLSGSINSTYVYLSDISGAITASGIPATVTLGGTNDTVATINPTSDLVAGRTYNINALSGVRSSEGINMTAHDRSRTFTTAITYTEVYSVTTTSSSRVIGNTSNGNTRIGIQMSATSSDLLNSTPKRVTMRLSKTGSPTGTATLVIRNNLGNIVSTIGTLNVATLTTSAAEYTITDNNQSIALASNYKLLLEYESGDEINFVNVYHSSSNVYDGTHLVYFFASFSSYFNETSEDVAWTIYKVT